MSKKVILVTGGQRSGKSGYAQRLALSLSPNPVYLATSRIWDEEFRKRVERHQRDRGPEWTNIEEEKYLSRKNNFNKVWKKSIIIILACLVILFASLFGAFAFSSDFRHAAVEVFEGEGDDYSRVSSASADRGTADAVTFTFINYTAINCKGGRKGMEASFLAKP